MRSADDAIEIPFTLKPPLCAALAATLEGVALAANDRYLAEFVEGASICPFARGGREAGETSRYVVHAYAASEEAFVEALLARFAAVAADRKQIVAQVIVPGIEVEPEQWVRFCDRVTARGHARLGGPAVLAFAALHPTLPYRAESSLALIPLFRRAPDPTIQWVRLDALAEIYAGRDTEVRFVDPADVAAFVRDAPAPKKPLYDKIAETNERTAHGMGLAKVEALLASMAADARATHERLIRSPDCARDG